MLVLGQLHCSLHVYQDDYGLWCGGGYCFRDSETGKQGLDRPFSIYTRDV